MGCLKNVLAGIGCGTLLIVGGAAGYHYRAQLRGLVASLADGRLPRDTVAARGEPSETALRRARRLERAMADPRGPASVDLTADELAALVQDELDPRARRALDSLRVVLEPDRLTIEALVVTAGLERGLFGPLGGVLDPREPLRMGGPAAVAAPGLVAWRPDALMVRAFPFPASVVPRVVDGIMGVRNGAVPIPVPVTVGRIRIRRDRVTFFRRTE